MFCYLDFRCYFEDNGQNHIHFRLIQVLKNSMAWHFLTFTSPSSKLEFVYPPCCGVEEQMLIFSSSLTPGRVKGSWIEIKSPSQPSYSPEGLLRVLNLLRPLTVLWKICHKKNSESGQRKMHPLTHRVDRVFIWVVPVAMHSGKS